MEFPPRAFVFERMQLIVRQRFCIRERCSGYAGKSAVAAFVARVRQHCRLKLEMCVGTGDAGRMLMALNGLDTIRKESGKPREGKRSQEGGMLRS